YGEERRSIDMDLAREVIEELEMTGVIAPPSPSAMASAPPPTIEAPAAVDHELETREARVVERERQLAEQQRILAEEYRLLRQPRPPSAPPIANEPVRA